MRAGRGMRGARPRSMPGGGAAAAFPPNDGLIARAAASTLPQSRQPPGCPPAAAARPPRGPARPCPARLTPRRGGRLKNPLVRSRRMECIYVDREKRNGSQSNVSCLAEVSWGRAPWPQLRCITQRPCSGHAVARHAVGARKPRSASLWRGRGAAGADGGVLACCGVPTGPQLPERAPVRRAPRTRSVRRAAWAWGSRCGGGCSTAGSTQRRSTARCCCSQRCAPPSFAHHALPAPVFRAHSLPSSA